MRDEAQARGYKAVEVDAQVQAIPFYERFGFLAHGEHFMDAGLPHIKMKLELKPQ